MVKRIQQHKLEDYSRVKHQLILPENWVVRDKDKDYGIDVEVEIFDKEYPTGLVYWVQLKATESKNENDAKKIDVKIDTLKYYKKLEIPVLIVRYSKFSDVFYCKWVSQIDLYYAKENAKSIRVKFTDNDIFDNAGPKKIVEYLKKIRSIKTGSLSLPVSVHIEIENTNVNNLPRAVFLSSCRMLINRYPSIIKYQSDRESSEILIKLSSDLLTVSLGSIIGCTFHDVDLYKGEDFNEFIIKNSILGVASIFYKIGQYEISAAILVNKFIIMEFLNNEEIW